MFPHLAAWPAIRTLPARSVAMTRLAMTRLAMTGLMASRLTNEATV